MSDLGFDIHLGGRAPKPVGAEIMREITQADLALLATERHIQPSHVQRLSDRHHALARCIATGMSLYSTTITFPCCRQKCPTFSPG